MKTSPSALTAATVLKTLAIFLSFAIALPATAGSFFSSGPVTIGLDDSGAVIFDPQIPVIPNSPTPPRFLSDQAIGLRLNGVGDALNPGGLGCPCEGWGIAANGFASFVGQALANAGINVLAPTANSGLFTSNTEAFANPGLFITQDWTIAATGADGALFQNTVTITNNTGSTATNVGYGRSLDWDVRVNGLQDFVTHQGVETTADLIYSSDNGHAHPDPVNTPLGAFPPVNPASVNSSFSDFGPADIGSVFIFDFGDLANGESRIFNQYYGAAFTEAAAVAMLLAVGAEVYSLGQDGANGIPGSDTFIAAFSGVGGVPAGPPTIPVPAALPLLLTGLVGLGIFGRRRRRSA